MNESHNVQRKMHLGRISDICYNPRKQQGLQSQRTILGLRVLIQQTTHLNPPATKARWVDQDYPQQ